MVQDGADTFKVRFYFSDLCRYITNHLLEDIEYHSGMASTRLRHGYMPKSRARCQNQGHLHFFYYSLLNHFYLD